MVEPHPFEKNMIHNGFIFPNFRGDFMKKMFQTPLPETNSKFAPENGWLEDYFYFQGRTVSFREGTT